MSLREMTLDDLALVGGWLDQPHVARWWLVCSSVEREMEDIRRSITGEQAVSVRIVLDGGEPIGWCQWYVCEEDPDWARDIGAQPGDVWMDYAIGAPEKTGAGLGTSMVAEMVRTIREVHPHVSIFADPDERNVASRRVLEKNGFDLIAVRPVPSENTDEPMAIYRLRPASTG